MADTTFTNGVTLTDSDWFQDVNTLTYTIFGDSTTTASAAARLAPSFNNLTVAGTLSVSAQATMAGLTVGGVLSTSATAAMQSLQVAGTISVSAAAVFRALAATDVSASAVAGLVVATQAQMEAGTSTTTIVTPGRQHFHPSAPKVWVQYDSTGSLISSYNMTSVTDNGAGNLSPVFATDFSSVNYAVLATAEAASTPASGTTWTVQVLPAGRAAGGCNIVTIRHSDFAHIDVSYVNVAAFGDQ